MSLKSDDRRRHECEVRAVANFENDALRAEFLAMVARHRGAQAAQALRLDVWALRKGK